MMGRSHAWSGILAGEVVVLPFSTGRELLLPGLLPVWPAPIAAMAIAICGGAAFLPDLDHTRSTVSRSLGFVTVAISWLVDRFSIELYHATCGPRDKADRKSGHRLITHTPVGAVAFGLLVTLAVVTHPIVAAVTLGLLVCLLADGFKLAGLVLVVGAGTGGWWVTTVYPGWWWLWGPLVTLGAQIHREGDWCTVQGVPRRSWPRMIDGRRWDMVCTSGAFTAGDDTELTYVRPLLIGGVVVAGILALGGGPLLVDVFVAVVDAIRAFAGKET